MAKVVLAFVGNLEQREIALLEATWEDVGGKDDQLSAIVRPTTRDLKIALRTCKADFAILFGVEATKAVTKVPLRKSAGATWTVGNTRCVPTWSIGCVASGEYHLYDDIYVTMRRVADMCNDVLPMPPIGGWPLEYEFIGHNGTRGYNDDDKVWSGYFEHTEEEVIRQEQLLAKWIARLDAGEVIEVGIDTEGFNTDVFNQLTMIQVYIDDVGYAFNWGVIEMSLPLWWTFLEHINLRFVLTNTKFDRQMFWHWLKADLGDRDKDTMVMAMGLTEKGKQTGLKYCARQFLGVDFYEEDLDVWLDYSDKGVHVNYGHIRPDVLAEYGCKDVQNSYKLRPILETLVEREGTTQLVENILLPAQRTLAEIEYHGINVDLDYTQSQSAEWAPLIDEAIIKVQEYARTVGFPKPGSGIGRSYREVCECVPVRARFHLEGLRVLSYAKTIREKFPNVPSCERCKNKRYVSGLDVTLNVHSPQQMSHLCHDILDMIPNIDRDDNPTRSCDKYFWADNPDHPLTELVLAYKELHYLKRNFFDGIQRFIGPDGHVHPDFLLFGTRTGRLAIHKPAAQTIPTRTKNGKKVKKIFIPSTDEYLIVNGDYASLEMFCNAHLTGDEVLLDDLNNRDLYKTAAAEFLNKAYDRITDEERNMGKPVVLSSGYGIGKKKLAHHPSLREFVQGDYSITQNMLDAFWGRYSTWSDWRKDRHEEVFKKNRLTTEFGRVRRWNLITPDNKYRVMNQAGNFPGQSIGSDICLTSLLRCHEGLTKNGWGRILLTVHDSLVAEIKKDHIHEGVALMKSIMENPPIKTDVPFKVDFTVGVNYGDQEDYKEKESYV
jgi:DNA polymerase I-like protein with 3'-5' exonuclease and polymerase domains